MQELQIAEEKGLKDVLVFQLCECDAVAAYSQEEARAWYKETTGLTDADLYSVEEVKTVPLNHRVYESEDSMNMVTVQGLLDIHWNGKPFIAFTSGY